MSLFLEPTRYTSVEISKLIDRLPNKKSSGFDSISNVLLKELKPYVLLLLTKIFNNSLATGIFPSKMLLTDVVPLHKNKSYKEPENYRPMSLLLTISKLLEKLIYKCTYGFLTRNN